MSIIDIIKRLDAAKAGRHDVRDYLLLLMTDRRGVRATKRHLATRADALA